MLTEFLFDISIDTKKLCLIGSISSTGLEEYLGMQFLMIHRMVSIDFQKQDQSFHLTH